MRVLLIHPPIREWSRPNMFPEGLGFVAAALRLAGHSVEVLDLNALRIPREEAERRMAAADYDLAGTGGIVTVYRHIKWITECLKKHHPSKPVMVGGSTASSSSEVVLEKTPADICCIGEGEITAVEALGALEAGQPLDAVRGLHFRRNGTRVRTPPRGVVPDMDSLPDPAWDLFPMDIYLKNPDGYYETATKWIDGSPVSDVKTLNVSATRGCPYRCAFCRSDFKNEAYRRFSVHRLLDKLQHLQRTYGVEYFQFQDDLFVFQAKIIREFCQAIRERGMVFEWGCTCRSNLADEDLFETMRDVGCKQVAMGFESGSQRMLDRMRKGVTVADQERAARALKKVFGVASGSFILGFPGETAETVQETVDFCRRLEMAPEVVFFATPYPGTPLWDMALAEGRIPDVENYLLNLGEQGEAVRVNFTDWSDAELRRIQQWMIAEIGALNMIRHEDRRE
jgi:radical SAM superfamily enzyme YgiQ (UPF0313 family)